MLTEMNVFSGGELDAEESFDPVLLFAELREDEESDRTSSKGEPASESYGENKWGKRYCAVSI